MANQVGEEVFLEVLLQENESSEENAGTNFVNLVTKNYVRKA